MADPADPVALPKTPEEVRDALARARAGDESTLPLVRLLVRDEECVRLLGGDLAGRVVAGFVAALGGADVGFREAVLQKLDALRAGLLGDRPTPVERLLVERVAACWLQVQHAELRYVQNLEAMTSDQGDYNQRRMDAANRRLLAAVKALALVRKLGAPVLQVNIAKKQVNVVAQATA